MHTKTNATNHVLAIDWVLVSIYEVQLWELIVEFMIIRIIRKIRAIDHNNNNKLFVSKTNGSLLTKACNIV